ncbi:DEK_C domain-containing protein, partial [Nephila pilipes]
MNSDSTKFENLDGSHASHFTLDGIVAEMVIEVDEEHGSISSLDKTPKLNGLDSFEKLKASALRRSFVALDSKLKISDISSIVKISLPKMDATIEEKIKISSEKSQETDNEPKSDKDDIQTDQDIDIILNETKICTTEEDTEKLSVESPVINNSEIKISKNEIKVVAGIIVAEESKMTEESKETGESKMTEESKETSESK